MREVISSILIILGTLTMSFGALGVLRAPTVYTRLHAASKAVALGLISFCIAGGIVNGNDFRMRTVLIALFLLITTPVASHMIAQSAHRTGED